MRVDNKPPGSPDTVSEPTSGSQKHMRQHLLHMFSARILTFSWGASSHVRRPAYFLPLRREGCRRINRERKT